MKKRLLGLFLCLCMAVFFLPVSVFAEPSGSWTEANNYDTSWYNSSQTHFTISNEADLAGLAVLTNGLNNETATSFSGKTITLGADLNLGAHFWTPIGKSEKECFAGIFDGNGYVIDNMKINIDTTGNEFSGLFGVVSVGTIKNTGVVNSSITAHSDVGGVVGYNKGGIVTNCYNTGAVSATGDNINNAGGVVGYDKGGIVTNCYNTGNVSVGGSNLKSVGGVVGNNSSSSTVTNCYNTGAVSASGDNINVVGGVVGNKNGGTVTNCYNTGAVSASGNDTNVVGGVVGNNYGTATNCYFLSGTTGATDKGIGEGTDTTTSLPAAQMKGAAGTTNGSDWVNISVGSENKGKIALVDALNFGVDAYNSTETPPMVTAYKWKQAKNKNGDYPYLVQYWTDLGNYSLAWYKNNTDADSFTIANEKDLAGLSVLVNGLNNETATSFSGKTITLGADLNLTGKLWTPIGKNNQECFAGIFDGNGYVIENMTVNIDKSGNQFSGLFGIVGGGIIKNTGVVNSNVTAHSDVGGVVGYNKGGIVTKCYNMGAVSASGGSINNAGGVVGYNYEGTVISCYNIGTVSAGGGDISDAGGVVGKNSSNSAVINCYNGGAVSSSGDENTCAAGGVVGYDSSNSAVINCYNVGVVSVGGRGLNTIGGVVGDNNGGAVTNCYFLSGTTGAADNGVGNGTDTTTSLPVAQMKGATGTTNGSDWVDISVGSENKGKIALVDALNFGVDAYNSTETPPTIKAFLWKQMNNTNDDYPIFEDLATKITLDKTTVVLVIGGKEKVTATVAPATAPQGVTWSSANKAVATVDKDGSITAVAAGSVKITATSLDGNASASCTVTVMPDVTLSFETNGGSAVDSITKNYNTEIDLSKYTTTKTGYTFAGWYADKALELKIDKIKIVKDTKVYAGWIWNNIFTDISEKDWFYHDVAKICAQGLMIGTDKNIFSPNVITTRGMLVTILWRMEGEPTVLEASPFKDVADGSYYEKAIAWAAKNKIVQGYGNNFFAPEDGITREQMATIFYRYAVYKGYDVSAGETTDISAFGDVQNISDYALTAMKWVCGIGLMKGDGKNLMPNAMTTRAETATMVARLLK